MSYSNDEVSMKRVTGFVGLSIGGLVVLLAVIMGAVAAFNAFGRSQDIADAHNKAQAAIIAANNQVQVTQIEISNQKNQILVTEQQAQIRYEQAVGIRKAQDEVAKTLTPLYVQFEMVQALQQIAESGRNNTVVYVPAGQGGVPTITANAATGK